jgi:integrase/recombinase XerC
MIESFLNYLAFEKRFSKHTIEAYNTDLKALQSFLNRTFEVEIQQAQFQMLRSWVMDLASIKMSPKSIHRKVASARSLYKFLIKKKLILSNPCLNLRLPKISKRLPVYVQNSDLKNLIKQADQSSSLEASDFEMLRDDLMLTFFYGAGIRRAELIDMLESDVDLSQMTVKITGKGNKQRLVPLHQSMVEKIKQYLNLKKNTFESNSSQNLFVTNNGLKTYPIFIHRIVKNKLNHLNNLEKKSPHVLRHTFATHLLDRGAELNAIKDLLGHSSLAATQVYTHNTPAKLKAVFDKAHPKS